MSLFEAIGKKKEKAAPCLSPRDKAFRIALASHDPWLLSAIESDIKLYERTGLLSRRLLRLLEAEETAKKSQNVDEGKKAKDADKKQQTS